MIAIREWNKLDQAIRSRISHTIFWNMSGDFINDLSKEFHHNFDWPGEEGSYASGTWYKLMLGCIYKTKDGGVKLIIKL